MLHRFSFLVCLLVIINTVCAREFVVGGSKGWTVPSDDQLYDQWAEKSRFQISDSLLFIYQPNQDSVLQVTRDAYDSCNTDEPTAKFTDGHTSFKLDRAGPYYFMSGNKDNCHKNQKLVIIVMADRSNTKTTTTSSPPPSPSVESSPSPTYTGTFEITPAPSQDTPGNSASPFASSVLPSAFIVTMFLSLFS
ncbi:early nodulin-like protein 3 [Brassica rapa]|uniref:Phytocyanin domain-containing protein n=1 Tax=Brassica campestris TaxID=3711 RepID=M4DQT9_BRACM|nr:early nodulin-like protein 3 [Brassica rapa]